MAEKQELIIEINVQSSIDNLANLKTSLNDLTKARQDLNEKSKAGDLEATKQLEILNAAIRNTQQEYRTQQRIIDGYSRSVANNTDTVKFSNNSIQQNRDLLKQLTAQYINMKNATPEAASKIKQLSDTLKQQEAAIGNTSRNVGNYSESFKDAFSTITSGIPGMQGFATAQKGINLALEANPIGAVIALLTGLFQIFSQNKEIADQVSFALAGLNKGFGFIVDTIVNTVTNLDNLTAALANPIKFIKDLAFGTANAAKEGYNASKAFDELTVSNARLNSKIAVNQEKVDALTKSLKNNTLEGKQRIKIANDIADLEIQNAKDLAELRQKELDALKMQNKDRTLSGEEQAKEIQKQGEVEIATLQAVTAENLRQTRIDILLEKEKTASIKDGTEKRNELRIQEIKSIDETLAKQKEATDKALDDENERELDAQVKAAQITAKRVGTINAAIDAEIIARNRALQDETLTETERENIIRESEDRIIKIKEDAVIKDIDTKKKAAEAAKQIDEAKYNAASSIADAFTSLSNVIGAQTEAGIAFQKAAAGIQLAINTAKSISAAIAGAAEAAASTGPGAPFALIGYVASMIATVVGAAAQASQLLSKSGNVNAPKFAKGIIGLDGEGTETSDSIPAYLSKGESVITAKATKEFHRELAMMEMAVGNKPNYRFGLGRFAGGFIPTMGDGGFVARDISKSNDMASQIQQAIQNGFALAPAPKLSIVEFEAKQSSRNRSVRVSEA